MPETYDAYERIMALEREEQAMIAGRDVEGLASALAEREKATQVFLESGSGDQSVQFLEKLIRIQKMNTQLRSEVKALHQSLKEELVKIRSENKRIGGYRTGALITPLTSRLINRKG